MRSTAHARLTAVGREAKSVVAWRSKAASKPAGSSCAAARAPSDHSGAAPVIIGRTLPVVLRIVQSGKVVERRAHRRVVGAELLLGCLEGLLGGNHGDIKFVRTMTLRHLLFTDAPFVVFVLPEHGQ